VQAVSSMPGRGKTRILDRHSPCARDGIRLFVLPGLPEIRKGDDLALKIVDAARVTQVALEDGDVLVVAQKIVSKAQGRIARLSRITASPRAKTIAAALQNDSRFIEVVLRESRRIVRQNDRVLIAETHHGFVCANAGVDRSNVPGRHVVSLLPRKPDQSAARLARSLRDRTGKRVAVIITDTFGRPWRLGLTNVAIGAAGVPALVDLRGTHDRVGKPLQATLLAVADELAASAGLLMGKAEGTPVVVIRGYRFRFSRQGASRIIRPAKEDLFR
jgi:coenzyme F420-0:L-glutamate ligase/coenzyme F420-1:gamma-L-glutamate ligase